MALTPAEKMKARRERLKAAGLCTRCGKRKATKGTQCKKCNDDAKKRVEESRKV
jgi:hypothetical protein